MEYLVSGVIPGRVCPYENDPEVEPGCYSFAVALNYIRAPRSPHQQGHTGQVYCTVIQASAAVHPRLCLSRQPLMANVFDLMCRTHNDWMMEGFVH